MSKNEITEQVEDALTYPILTQQVDGQQPSTGTSAISIAGGSSIDSVAQSTIRRILGWRYRPNDTKGFTAALTKTFALKEVEGHVEWEWKPQNYMVQADLGEITGAQASIYTRAKAALDQALPLLDGLTPLREDADPEDCEAIRALVRTEFKDQLIPELGKPGGPVVQLVQQMFYLLVGSQAPISDLETVGGHLGELRFRFGLDRRRVNNVAEEVNLTNFLIVVDYINSLYTTWIAQGKFLGRLKDSPEPFLGTQLVLLSQQLEEVAESVGEAYDAMDSVFFGPAERQTTKLKFDNQPFITVAELLAWVEKFSTVDGPQWLQDSGKDGVGLVASTAAQLHDLVSQASHKSKSSSSNPARAFHTARVHRAFDVIRDGLQATSSLAYQIKTVDQPRQVAIRAITKVDPIVYSQGTDSAPLTISGHGLSRAKDAYLEPSDPRQAVIGPYAATPKPGQEDTLVTAAFNLNNAWVGAYTLILKDSLEQPIQLSNAFTVRAPKPLIVDVQPTISEQENVARLKIIGTGFDPVAAAVTLEYDDLSPQPSGKILSLTKTQIIATFDLSLVEGTFTLVVKNPDGQCDKWEKKATVRLPAPEIDWFVPSFANTGDKWMLTVHGRHFRPPLTVELRTRCGTKCFKADDPEVTSKSIVATFKYQPPAPGSYYVIVTIPGEYPDEGQQAWSKELLEICGEQCPDDDELKPIAYMLYVLRGRNPDHDKENWRDAEVLWRIMQKYNLPGHNI